MSRSWTCTGPCPSGLTGRRDWRRVSPGQPTVRRGSRLLYPRSPGTQAGRHPRAGAAVGLAHTCPGGILPPGARDARGAVGPRPGDEGHAGPHPLMLAAPVPGHPCRLVGTGLVQGRIIDSPHATGPGRPPCRCSGPARRSGAGCSLPGSNGRDSCHRGLTRERGDTRYPARRAAMALAVPCLCIPFHCVTPTVYLCSL